MNLLEQAVEEKAMALVQECEKDNAELYSEFLKSFNKIKKHIPHNLLNDFYNLDNLFVQRYFGISKAYKAGFQDGMQAFMDQFRK